jgi:hypothetical protein
MRLARWIAVLTLVWLTLATTTSGQTLPFLDDFADGSEIDGQPGTWSDSGDAVQLLDGDLVISASAQRGRTILSELAGAANVSFQTAVNFPTTRLSLKTPFPP